MLEGSGGEEEGARGVKRGLRGALKIDLDRVREGGKEGKGDLKQGLGMPAEKRDSAGGKRRR